MTANDFDTALKQSLEKLPRDIQPQRDLWKGVELAIAQQTTTASTGRKSKTPLFASAASVALIAAISWISWHGAKPDDATLNGQALVNAMSQQHAMQKQALLVQYTDVPKVVNNWQQQLNELDEAAAAIKAALEEDPDNKALLKMLQNVHHQQIALIERVHAPKWQQT